jgi:hypothetical protein
MLRKVESDCTRYDRMDPSKQIDQYANTFELSIHNPFPSPRDDFECPERGRRASDTLADSGIRDEEVQK